MDKVSVVVPMYNSESFISQCVSSVTAQTYGNWEMIIVDDGSTDMCHDICAAYCQSDNRIHLHRQAHGGISCARNRGLDMASGEYVFFLDSDDAIHPHLFDELVRQMKEKAADMALFHYTEADSMEMDNVLQDAGLDEGAYGWDVIDGIGTEELFRTEHHWLSRINGLIRRGYIGDIRFDETLGMGEDTMFMYRLACKRGRTVYSSCGWYYYRMHPGSVTHSMYDMYDNRFDSVRMLRNEEYEKKHHGFALRMENRIVGQLCKSYAICRERGDKAGCVRLERMAESEMRHPMFSHVKPSIRLRYFVCFHFHPLYKPLDRMICKLWEYGCAAGLGKPWAGQGKEPWKWRKRRL